MANVLATMFNTLAASIGTSFESSGSTWTYAPIAAGIDNVSEALNEVVQQYFFMDDEGFARNNITGMAPAFTFTGRRMQGDAAQDYIFGAKYGLLSNRASSFQMVATDNSQTPATTKTLTVPCTICNIQEWSGATTDDSAISFEIRFDGKPQITES